MDTAKSLVYQAIRWNDARGRSPAKHEPFAIRMPSDPVKSNLSSLYHALRTARRRHVIQYLADRPQELVETRELARSIASEEENVPLRHATGEPYRNAYNALSQTHLPTLADAEIIIYDSQRQTVSQGPRFEIAALLLKLSIPALKTVQELQETNADDQ